METVVTLTARMAVDRMLGSKLSLSDTREAIVNKCIDILAAYQAYCARGSASAHLMTPDSLRLLPLYTLALIKNVAFRSGSDIKPSERASHLMWLNTQTVPVSSAFIHPRLYNITSLSLEHVGDGKVQL